MSASATGSTAFKMMFMDVCRTECLGEQTCSETRRLTLDVQCYLQLIMRGLSYLVIMIEVYGTLPLLYKILRYQEGKSYISTAKITTLFVTNTIFVAYAVYWNLPFHTWGEGLLQMALYVIIVNLMLLYHGRQLYAVLFMLAYFPLMVLLVMPILPRAVISGLMACTLPIVFWRRTHGVFKLHKDKGVSNNVTKTSLVLMNFCCFCRLYTSWADAGNWLLTRFYAMECLFITLSTLQYMFFSTKRRIAKRSHCPSG